MNRTKAEQMRIKAVSPAFTIFNLPRITSVRPLINRAYKIVRKKAMVVPTALNAQKMLNIQVVMEKIGNDNRCGIATILLRNGVLETKM
jgi:hypothetical protein